MIANDFIIKKDFRTYTTIILRQDKRLRDHAPTAGAGVHYWVVSAARWAWDETASYASDLPTTACRAGSYTRHPAFLTDVVTRLSCHARAEGPAG